MTHRRRASATDNSAVIERLERERDDLRAALDNCRADLQAEKHRRQKCAAAPQPCDSQNAESDTQRDLSSAGDTQPPA